jgi:hypothetical protein
MFGIISFSDCSSARNTLFPLVKFLGVSFGSERDLHRLRGGSNRSPDLFRVTIILGLSIP